MLGISNRTAAALAATVVLLPLLVFVDLPAAEAHEQTTTRRPTRPAQQARP